MEGLIFGILRHIRWKKNKEKSAQKTLKIFKVKHIDGCWIQSIFNNVLCSGNFITKQNEAYLGHMHES